MEGAQDMQGIPNPKNTPPAYLHPLGAVTDADILSEAFWESTAPVNSQVSAIADTRLLASSEGYARGKKGSSLDMGKAKVHAYLIFGRCERDNSGPVIDSDGLIPEPVALFTSSTPSLITVSPRYARLSFGFALYRGP